MATEKTFIGTRLPQDLIEKIATLVEGGQAYGLQSIPRDRTAFIIQACRAYLPAMEAKLETEKAAFARDLLHNPANAIDPTKGKLLGGNR